MTPLQFPDSTESLTRYVGLFQRRLATAQEQERVARRLFDQGRAHAAAVSLCVHNTNNAARRLRSVVWADPEMTLSFAQRRA
jgi:hypothetical protein